MKGLVSPKLFILLSAALVLLIVIYPWILGVIIISCSLGYFSLDFLEDKLKQVLKDRQLFISGNSTSEISSEIHHESDPLLHIQQQITGNSLNSRKGKKSAEKGGKPVLVCGVCEIENCPRNGEEHHNHPNNRSVEKSHDKARKSPTALLSPAISNHSRGDHDLRIDPRLDAALSRFCSTVFDYYIRSSWAPYETRKQLKLAFKQLLTTFADRVKLKLILLNNKGEETAEKFCREKLIPLYLHYLEEMNRPTNRPINFSDVSQKQKRAKLKVRKLCRKVFKLTLSKEDQNCRLWMELCVAVLADGVLWNLIILGRDKIPELLEEVVNNYTISSPEEGGKVTEIILEAPTSNPPISKPRRVPIIGEDVVDLSGISGDFFDDPLSNQQFTNKVTDTTVAVQENTQLLQEGSSTVKIRSGNKVPFLVSSFLDPVNDIEQPDTIVSRWRPTLNEILGERELLYSLIQYLKEHQALEYLQAVLDESPDANDYCRKVLELEHLPGFCRSSLFLENMGLSRVEVALEVAMDSNGSRRDSGHSRSASYGGGNPGIQIRLFERGIVDGLPLYTSTVPMISPSSSAVNLPVAGSVEPDFVFKRKPASLELVISKFFSSTVNHGKKNFDFLSDKPEPAKRVGIDSKTYEERAHADVNTSVVLGEYDIMNTFEAVTSWITLNSWTGPILTGWLQLLHPYLKPHFDSFLEQKLNEFLTLDLFVEVVDLISDAFVKENPSFGNEADEQPHSHPKVSTKPCNKDQPSDISKSTAESFLETLVKIFFTKVLDPEVFTKSMTQNKDSIMMFFVDVLDVLVTEISD